MEENDYISVHISNIDSLQDDLLENVKCALEVFKHLGESETFQFVNVSKTSDKVEFLRYVNDTSPNDIQQNLELAESWTIEFMNGGTKIQHHKV